MGGKLQLKRGVQSVKPNQFCKKLAEVIVILNRAFSIDKHTKKSQNTCLSLLLRELFLRNSSNNAIFVHVGKKMLSAAKDGVEEGHAPSE